MDVESLKSNLAQYGQEHLLQFWSQLTNDQQVQLYNEIKSIDVAKVTKIFKQCIDQSNVSDEKIDNLLQPIPPELHGSVSRTSPNELQAYRELGLKEISNGHVAALLLAGGQGTRLGVTNPKGMYDVNLPSHKTLYQIQCERLQRLEQLAYEYNGKRGTIPWYIMTSEQTMEPTLEFFEKHNHFGMDGKNLVVFEQSMMPCFEFNGKIILETSHKIAKAPDGNGGLYGVLERKGILADMAERGVKYVHVYCVDNILVKMADPVFIGYCLTKKATCAAKVVEKAFPTEAVGVVCKVKGKYQVVEYSEISLNTAQKRNADGRLTFNAGNICNHFFSLDFLRNVVENKELKHHIAKKKIPYINEDGKQVKPEKPNGVKLEKFVFDVFEFTQNFAVWEVLREDEFSPLKNADGAEKDTPTTARHSLYNLHQRYVLQAGGKFVDEDGSPIPLIPSPVKAQNGYHDSTDKTNGHAAIENNDSQKSYLKYEYPVICEISPLMSYEGEGLEDFVVGKKFVPPLVLPELPEKNGC